MLRKNLDALVSRSRSYPQWAMNRCFTSRVCLDEQMSMHTKAINPAWRELIQLSRLAIAHVNVHVSSHRAGPPLMTAKSPTDIPPCAEVPASSNGHRPPTLRPWLQASRHQCQRRDIRRRIRHEARHPSTTLLLAKDAGGLTACSARYGKSIGTSVSLVG
jgi:hypothetical protein